MLSSEYELNGKFTVSYPKASRPHVFRLLDPNAILCRVSWAIWSIGVKLQTAPEENTLSVRGRSVCQGIEQLWPLRYTCNWGPRCTGAQRTPHNTTAYSPDFTSYISIQAFRAPEVYWPRCRSFNSVAEAGWLPMQLRLMSRVWLPVVRHCKTRLGAASAPCFLGATSDSQGTHESLHPISTAVPCPAQNPKFSEYIFERSQYIF